MSESHNVQYLEEKFVYILVQESGTVVYSLDALFGLPRKKAAGKSFRDPLHGNLFFANQQMVDEYVATHKSRGKPVLKVSDWNAADK